MKTIESMEWWCNNCGGIGEVPTNGLNLDNSICIVCSHCSHPTLYAWCEKCGAGIEREEIDLTNQPKTWVCETCGREYQFPAVFYQRPVYFKPSEFSELVYVDNINFRKYEHINVDWLRKTFLFWDEHRTKALAVSIILFGLAIIILFISRVVSKAETITLIGGLIALISLILFFFPIFIDIIFWLISSMFILSYKLRNK